MTGVANPEATARIVRQGREDQPVLIVDDLLADPERWRAAAAAARFAPIGPHYPGIRAAIPPALAEALRDAIVPMMGDTFGAVPSVLEAYFSIVTTPPERLAPIQRLPHFDGFEAERIAVLLYLSGAAQGGTAFYRQRATGFETVDAARFPAFEAALRTGVAEHGLPDAAYIDGDTPLYERIAVHAARPNRALVYRSQTLHCAAIPPDIALPADPATGRLSVNLFLYGG